MNHGCFSVSESLNSSNIKIIAWSCSQLLCLMARLWLTLCGVMGRMAGTILDRGPEPSSTLHVPSWDGKIAFGKVCENLDSTFPVFLCKALWVEIY